LRFSRTRVGHPAARHHVTRFRGESKKGTLFYLDEPIVTPTAMIKNALKRVISA
jgi:hypothetical protein